MMDKIKSMANQAKLTAEIALLKERIAGLKRAWGEQAFDLFETDLDACRAKHAAVRVEIDKAEAKLRQKEAENRTPVVATPVPTVVAVTVPEGVSPGQTITVAHPNGGRSVQAVVPHGLAPGAVFHVQIPA